MAFTITVGTFSLDGFDANATFLGGASNVYGGPFFAGALTDNGAVTVTDGDNNVLNSTGNTVFSTATTGNQWTLFLQLGNNLLFGTNGGEELMVNSNAIDGTLDGAGNGAMGGAGVTVNGTGDVQLAQFLKQLQVNTNGGPAPDFYSVTFTLTDVNAAATSTWTEYFGACYAAGTRIAVPGGEKMVDDLRIGDLVITATGASRPVKWMGYRRYTAAVVASNPHVRSVLVRKDALAPGMPHRDLSVSSMHALFIDDVFVPAIALVNGVSILRNQDIAPITYFHIEMDGHDVIFAEGQPAETYVDDDSRQMFDNADEYYALHGADQGKMTFSAPRIEEGIQLEALRRRIAARAGLAAPAASTGKLQGHVERLEDGVLHGWVFDTASPSTPVELEILADGEVIATAIANRYRVDLDYHGLAGGRAGFTVALPASVTSLAQVSVRRVMDRARVAVPQSALVN